MSSHVLLRSQTNNQKDCSCNSKIWYLQGCFETRSQAETQQRPDQSSEGKQGCNNYSCWLGEMELSGERDDEFLASSSPGHWWGWEIPLDWSFTHCWCHCPREGITKLNHTQETEEKKKLCVSALNKKASYCYVVFNLESRRSIK